MSPELLRIIDANFNRSREALRVMEEYARFVLNDARSTAMLKSIRHELTQIICGLLPAEQLLASRDTPADVGTTLSTASEKKRDDAAAVFIAAARRLGESLRALEEYGKVIDPGLGERIETWRYHTYEIEKKLAFAGGRHELMRRARLYVLVTDSLCAGDWLETIRQVAQAGAHVVQLREKQLDDGELLRRACAAVEVCRTHDTLFIMNDRPDLARLCQADGVHVGQDDLPVSSVRRIVGPDVLVGTSTHDPQQLAQAIDQDPDYVAVGPMFATETKPQDRIAGPEFLAHAAQATELPLVAIGGINTDNLGRLNPPRPCCLAVCAAIIAKPDPAKAVADLLEQLDASAPPE